MPYTRNELVQVKLRVQNSLNEYPGRSRDYFIAITGPGIQLGNEDPKIAPRCRLIRQNIWEKELWLPKECRINYKFLVVYSPNGSVKDTETVVPRQLHVGQFPVTMEHVYNQTDERKIVETKNTANRWQNKNGSHKKFTRPKCNTQGAANKVVAQDVKTGCNGIYNEEEIKVENRVPVATDLVPKQQGIHTKVINSQIHDNNSTPYIELDIEKIEIQAAPSFHESEQNQPLQEVHKTKDVPSTTDNYVNVANQLINDDFVDTTPDNNKNKDTNAITTTEIVITTTESVAVTNVVLDKKGRNCEGLFGGKGIVVALSCVALAGLGYVTIFRK